MGKFVEDYKRWFNLEDRFDHLFSSIDSKVRFVSKEARWVEIMLIVAVVNAYTLTCEVKVRSKYRSVNGRRLYHAEITENAHLQIREQYPLKEFIFEVLDGLATLASSQ